MRVEVRKRLVEAVTALDATVQNTKRRRSPVEAPFELTHAYLRLAIATSLARLGALDQSRALVESARRVLEPTNDDVHLWLLRWSEERIETAGAGRVARHWPSTVLLRSLNKFGRQDRYKIDRMREAVARPDGGALDAIGRFSQQHNQRNLESPEWTLAIDTADRATCAESLADARSDEVFETLLELPEERALPILVRAIPLFDTPAAAAKALAVIARFGWGELVPGPSSTVLAAPQLEATDALVTARALRRLGLHLELEQLVERLQSTRGTAASVGLSSLVLAGSLSFLGDKRAEPLFRDAENLLPPTGFSDPDGIARWLAHGYSLAAVDRALAGVAELVRHLPTITDSFGTSSHYCFSLVYFVGTMLLVIDELADDGA